MSDIVENKRSQNTSEAINNCRLHMIKIRTDDDSYTSEKDMPFYRQVVDKMNSNLTTC